MSGVRLGWRPVAERLDDYEPGFDTPDDWEEMPLGQTRWPVWGEWDSEVERACFGDEPWENLPAELDLRPCCRSCGLKMDGARRRCLACTPLEHERTCRTCGAVMVRGIDRALGKGRIPNDCAVCRAASRKPPRVKRPPRQKPTRREPRIKREPKPEIENFCAECSTLLVRGVNVAQRGRPPRRCDPCRSRAAMPRWCADCLVKRVRGPGTRCSICAAWHSTQRKASEPQRLRTLVRRSYRSLFSRETP